MRAVSRISSASAAVPRWTRSTPASADHQRRRASVAGQVEPGGRGSRVSASPVRARELRARLDCAGYRRVTSWSTPTKLYDECCRVPTKRDATVVRCPDAVRWSVSMFGAGQVRCEGVGGRRDGSSRPMVRAIRRVNASRGTQRGEAGDLAHTAQPVPHRVGVHEQRPGGALQHAAGGEEAVEGLQQLPAGPDQRPVHVLAQDAARLDVAGEGPLGQQVGGGHRARCRRPGRRGPEPGQRRPGRLGRLLQRRHRRADHDRPVAEAAEQLLGRGERVGGAAEHEHQPVAVDPAEHVHAHAAGRAGAPCAGSAARLAAGGAADRDRHRGAVVPAERGRPAGQLVRRVRRAAARRRACACSRASQVPRDSAARAYTRAALKATSRENRRIASVTAALLAGRGQAGHLLLDDVDGDLDELDRVLEADRPGQRARARRRRSRRRARAGRWSPRLRAATPRRTVRRPARPA